MKLSEVLSSPEKWCKGIRQDDKGRCCLMGALSLKHYGSANRSTEIEHIEPMRQAVWDYIKKNNLQHRYNMFNLFVTMIAYFNDHVSTTFKDIQEVIKIYESQSTKH